MIAELKEMVHKLSEHAARLESKYSQVRLGFITACGIYLVLIYYRRSSTLSV